MEGACKRSKVRLTEGFAHLANVENTPTACRSLIKERVKQTDDTCFFKGGQLQLHEADFKVWSWLQRRFGGGSDSPSPTLGEDSTTELPETPPAIPASMSPTLFPFNTTAGPSHAGPALGHTLVTILKLVALAARTGVCFSAGSYIPLDSLKFSGTFTAGVAHLSWTPGRPTLLIGINTFGRWPIGVVQQFCLDVSNGRGCGGDNPFIVKYQLSSLKICRRTQDQSILRGSGRH
jgi:hypothetical protein